MRKSLSDKYILSLVCITFFLTITYGFLATFNKLGWFIIPTIFGILQFFVIAAQIVRTFVPKFRNSILHQIFILFDLVEFAKIIKGKMNQLSGKGKKKRQGSMIGGTFLYGLSMFIIINQVFFGVTLTNMDNGTTGYAPPIYQQVTVGSLIILMVSGYLLCISILIIGYGFYNKFENSSWVKAFVDSFPKNTWKKSKEPTFWDKLNKKQKYKFVSVFLSFFTILIAEFALLGLIDAPALAMGNSPVESKVTAQDLGIFGNWTNILIGDIGVLALIGLTFWVWKYVQERFERTVEKSQEITSDAKT